MLRCHPPWGWLVAVPGEARAEEGAAFDSRSFDVSVNRLSGRKMNSFGFVVPAFDLKAQRGFVSILGEVGDVELAARRDARAGRDVQLQDGAVAQVENRISRRHPDELAHPGFGEGTGFLDRIGGFTRDELRVSGVGHGDGQPQLGGRTS
jgi:hypothetical protein